MKTIDKVNNMFDIFSWISNNLDKITGIPMEKLEFDSWDILETNEFVLEVQLTDGSELSFNAEDIAKAIELSK
jgi:hypothetical protein